MKNSIIGNEIVTCRIHWVCYWKSWLLTVIFLIGSVDYLILKKPTDALILLGGAAIFAIIPVYQLFANRITLTDKMIYARRGIIKTRELSAPIDKVQNIEIKKTILGRIFGYATVKVDTISGVYILRGVKNADKLNESFFMVR